MNAHAQSLLLPAGLQSLQEAVPRMESAGDKLEAAWATFRADLTRLAAALGIRAERREDILQEVYLTARDKCPAGLKGDPLRLWLLRVTANACRLEHRRRQRWGKVLGALQFWRTGVESSDAGEHVERLELTEGVEAALGRLTMMEREIVVLRYFCDFNSSQIGEMLSLPAATVRSHLAKARKQLARELAEWK